MIRDAKFVDIPAMVRLLQGAHSRSRYAGTSVSVDEAAAAAILTSCLMRHGGKEEGATWVQVADSGAGITGLVVGVLQRIQLIGDRLMGTDMLWYCGDDSSPRDARALMTGMINWAWSSPFVVEVQNATTTVIMNDPADAGRILVRLGMELCGNIYRMERPTK